MRHLLSTLLTLPLAASALAACTATGASTEPFRLAAQAADSDAGPPPDYALASSWAARETKSAARDADVFYIHPTTFQSRDWNQRMDDKATRAWTVQSVAQRQLNAFAACCRLFMPFYRQASSRAFIERDGRGAQAYDFAYRDVRQAFRNYIAKLGKGRPFIIAGHSQGALLGLRLLKEEIAGTPLADRLVAAYLPGIGIPKGTLPSDVPPCTSPGQTRCVASWNGFSESAETTAWKQRSVADYGAPGQDPALVCTNPMTFDATLPAAGFADGKGMLPVAQKDRPAAPLVHRAVAARCVDGILRVRTASTVEAQPLPNGSLHMHDIALFWADISANAALRAQRWQEDHR